MYNFVTTLQMKTNIRKGLKADTDNLVALNRLWFRPNLENNNRGFLSVTYDNTFFESIIENDDLLVFENGNQILGYVLVNTIINTQHIENIKSEYFELKPETKPNKIAFSYQILVDRTLQGTGFFYSAQQEYFNYYKTKYEMLISTVSKDNLRSIKAHKKAGWAFIDTTKYYFIIEKSL